MSWKSFKKTEKKIMVRKILNVTFSLIWGVVNSVKKNSLFGETASDFMLLKKRKI